MRFGGLHIDKVTLVVVLTAAELLTLAALVAMTVLWRRERAVVTTASRSREGPSGLPPAWQAAGWAVRTMLDAPGRVRERGFVGGMLMAPIEELTGIALQEREEIDAVAARDGTVTILFSDIEDSTGLNDRLGDEAWVRLLTTHDRVVRAAVERYGGHVVKSQGDGFMVVFGSADEAVAAASRIQRKVGHLGRRLKRTPVRVRIGIHAGTAVARDGDYFGRNVAKAARVTALAEGGQTLVTEEVRERLGAGTGLEERGIVELRGLPDEHVLWQVVDRRKQ